MKTQSKWPQVDGLSVHKGMIHCSTDEANLTALIDPDKIFLIRLAALSPGQGYGSYILGQLKKFSWLVCKPIQLYSVSDHKRFQARLNRFYVRHGFKRKHDKFGREEYVCGWPSNFRFSQNT